MVAEEGLGEPGGLAPSLGAERRPEGASSSVGGGYSYSDADGAPETRLVLVRLRRREDVSVRG